MTADDWRNFGHQITELLAFEPRCSFTLFDLRVGFKRAGKWKIARFYALQPVKQNFWNAMLALQIYITIPRRFPFPFPRIALSSRYSESAWFQTHLGWLFDRGEFAGKFVFSSLGKDSIFNPGVNAPGWEEGGI